MEVYNQEIIVTHEAYYMSGTVLNTSYLLNSQTASHDIGIIIIICGWWIWATEKLSWSHVSGRT